MTNLTKKYFWFYYIKIGEKCHFQLLRDQPSYIVYIIYYKKYVIFKIIKDSVLSCQIKGNEVLVKLGFLF